MYLDPKGKDASLLDKKIKEHIAESQSRKQKDGRKRSTVNKELAEEDQVEHTVEHSQENSLHTPTFKQGSPANKEGGDVEHPAKKRKGKEKVKLLFN